MDAQNFWRCWPLGADRAWTALRQPGRGRVVCAARRPPGTLIDALCCILHQSPPRASVENPRRHTKAHEKVDYLVYPFDCAQGRLRVSSWITKWLRMMPM